MAQEARRLWRFPQLVIVEFFEDDVFRYSAAISFYAILSLAPLVVIVLGFTAIFVDVQSVKEELVDQVDELIGTQGATVLSTVLRHAETNQSRGTATAVGIVVSIFGATAVFAQLQDALNRIWGVQPSPDKFWWSLLMTRIISFGVVLSIGFLLLISLLVSAAITTVSTTLSLQLPGGSTTWYYIDTITSLIVITLLFILLFRYLPDVRIAWRDVWVGAVITAVLFTLGKRLIGYYLGHSAVTSVYGAAGSLVALLFWIYYSALIIFFGAEIAQVYSRLYGRKIKPRRFAYKVKP